jgi:hypothetical protein
VLEAVSLRGAGALRDAGVSRVRDVDDTQRPERHFSIDLGITMPTACMC